MFKLGLDAIYSPNTDYSNEDCALDESDIPVFEKDAKVTVGPMKISVAVGSTSINPDRFGLIGLCLLALKNIEEDDYVDVQWIGAPGISYTARVPPGGLLVMPDVDASQPGAITFVTVAAVTCKLFFVQLP